MTSSRTVLDEAHYYAARAWRVVPILPGQKRPALDAWVERATVDHELIDDWWRKNPTHGVGIVTGELSGLFVLDIDPEHGGDDTLADLEHTHGALPDTIETITGSGGRHILFAWPGWNPGTNAGQLGPGLDLRAEGGQIVAPPTIHPNGLAYQWEVEHDPHDGLVVAPAPDWLLDLLRAPAPAEPRREVAPYSGEPRPGDRFAASVTWPELLERDGAECVARRTDHKTAQAYELWTRPGKNARDGASASLYYGGTDVLKVFTTNWPGLTEGQTYNRFAYLTATRYGGDFKAAARALAGVDGDRDRVAAWIASLPDLDDVPAAPAPEGAPATGALEAINPFVFIDGGTFVFDQPEGVPARWGTDDRVLWARGESCVLAGGPGVGKSTLTANVLRGLLGADDTLLGLTIEPAGRILYLALDRPRQIARLLRRVIGNDLDRATLEERLIVRAEPLAINLIKKPEHLLDVVRAAGAEVVIVDSLKDVIVDPANNEQGGSWNLAMQHCIAAGVDVLALHHNRKKIAGDNKQPKSLSEVYGSAWITAGAGSVVLLYGDAGDAVVDLVHLKQPAAEVGPLKIEHGHNGRMVIAEAALDPRQALKDAHAKGITVDELARLITKKKDVNKNDCGKARRELNKLVDLGLARLEEGRLGGDGGRIPHRYFPVDVAAWVSGLPQLGSQFAQFAPSSGESSPSANGQVRASCTPSSPSDAPVTKPTPPFRGVGDLPATTNPEDLI